MKKEKKKQKFFVDELALARQREYTKNVLKSFEQMGYKQPRTTYR